MDAVTTPELVHLAILKDAARFANEAYGQEFDMGNLARWRPGRFNAEKRRTVVFGDVFRPDPIQSRKGGLCLSIDPRIADAMEPEDQQRMREIGRKAIKRSLSENRGAFIGLILGEARQGRNYFDRFSPPAQQRMF